MLKDSKAFSGFSVNDLDQARTFYGDTLGLSLDEQANMGFTINFPHGHSVFVYPKNDHQPATFTILNFPVEDIYTAVEELTTKGVVFEQYNNSQMPQDEKGVLRGRAAKMGPDIAWFKDPAGNILAILQN